MAFISAHRLILCIVAQTEPQLELQNLFSVGNSQLLMSVLLCWKSCCSMSFSHTALPSPGYCVTLITSVVHVFHFRCITDSAQLLCYYLGISSWMTVPAQYLIMQIFILPFNVRSAMWISQTAFARNLNCNPWLAGKFCLTSLFRKKKKKKITCLEFDISFLSSSDKL